MDKYLQGRCTAEEAGEVEHWLNAPQADLDEVLPVPDKKVLPAEKLDGRLSHNMLQHVMAKTNDGAKVIWLRRLVAAAAVAAALVVGWYALTAKTVKTVNAGNGAVAIVDSILHMSNDADSTIAYRLADGSVVTLFPRSSIAFSRNLGQQVLRNIQLSGKADFLVSANPQRPFTVQSGAVYTTAIGTRFIVTAFTDSSTVTVQLFHGKVQVETPVATGGKKDIKKLIPGDWLVYDCRRLLATVYKPKQHSKMAVLPAPPMPGKAPVNTAPTWFKFNGQPLAEVLHQLSAYYGQPIDFKNEDMRHKYFAGTFDKTDSLEQILHDIALVNQLTLERHNGRYLLKKQAAAH